MNYRYLVCALCMTEWNMERVKCTSCEEEKGVAYLTVEVEGRLPADVPIRAETCDECKTYLKIFMQEKDPNIDPIADDLNSLALDMLVDERATRGLVRICCSIPATTSHVIIDSARFGRIRSPKKSPPPAFGGSAAGHTRTFCAF